VNATVAHIGLGSNVGRREQTLARAVEMLSEHDDISVIASSSFILTEPEGGPAGQDPYVNGAVTIYTSLSPLQLLQEIRDIESGLGRNRDMEQRWGPRTCDLDILLMGDVVMESPELTIPHPRMHERLFVLKPLAEIAPHAVHPVSGLTVSGMLQAIGDGGRKE